MVAPKTPVAYYSGVFRNSQFAIAERIEARPFCQGGVGELKVGNGHSVLQHWVPDCSSGASTGSPADPCGRARRRYYHIHSCAQLRRESQSPSRPIASAVNKFRALARQLEAEFEPSRQ